MDRINMIYMISVGYADFYKPDGGAAGMIKSC